MLFLLFICSQILAESQIIIDSMRFSLNIWASNIFPSLFPFFIISDLLINYGLLEFITCLFSPLMYKLFKIKGESSFVFFLSMISGFPSSAKYTKELYDKKLINEYEASKILTFTHFSNPVFIITTIGLIFLNNKEVGLLILIIHYMTNIIIGLIFRNYYPSKNDHKKSSLSLAFNKMHQKRINNKDSFGSILTASIYSSINTLLLILGIVALFMVVSTIISSSINLNDYNKTLVSGILEMTGGLKNLSLLAIPLKNKAILAVFFISFGGISVHMQIISIISNTKIKYLPFFVARLLHGSISSIILYLLFDYYLYFFI